MIVIGWRFALTDKTFHCYTLESKHSLCNAHELTRHGATAMQEDLPRETICPFCKAILKRFERKRRDALKLASSQAATFNEPTGNGCFVAKADV